MQKQALELVTAPTSQPISMEEAKIHLRLGDQDEEDLLIETFLAAATEQAEEFTRRRFVTQTWKVFMDEFQCDSDDAILLPYPPTQSITHVKYYDVSGTLVTLVNNTDYVLDSKRKPARLLPASNVVWPTVQTDKPNAVEIQFVCGYGTPSVVPSSIKAACLLILANLFEHRQELIVGNIVNQIPKASEWLLWPYRDFRFV